VISYEIGAKSNGERFALDIFNLLGEKVQRWRKGLPAPGLSD